MMLAAARPKAALRLPEPVREGREMIGEVLATRRLGLTPEEKVVLSA